MSSSFDLENDEVSAEEAEILAYLLQQEGQQANVAPRIKPREASQVPLLSFAQERLWLLDRLEPGNAFYNVPLVLSLRGRLQVSALLDSLQLILSRHDCLRTRFILQEDTPVQVVDAGADFELRQQDISNSPRAKQSQALADLIRAEESRPFDLQHVSNLSFGATKNEAGVAVYIDDVRLETSTEGCSRG